MPSRMNRANLGARVLAMAIELMVTYAMRAQCEPGLLRRRPPPFQGPAWKDPARHKLFATLLAVVALLGFSAWWFDLSPSTIFAFELGVIAAMICMVLVLRRFWIRWFQREAALTPLNRWPMAIKIDAEGVHSDNEVLRQTVSWPGVIAVTQSADATGVWFSRITLIVLPDRALPAGMDREALIRLIEEYRGAA